MKQSVIVLLLLGCVMPIFARAPKYQKPEVTAPQNWQAPAPWREAAPKDSIAKGTWWTLFSDAELNQ